MSFLAVLWFFLIFLLIAGYFVLDGFDLGTMILMPFVAKTNEEKSLLKRMVGPVWDGNEVWLLTAGGALFAAFPGAYATTFSGFYLAIMLVLFCLILRAVAFEFGAQDKKLRSAWNWCLVICSLLPSILFGVALGCVFEGIEMDNHGNYIGLPLIGLITPITLLFGVFSLFMFVSLGASWICLKAPLDSTVYSSAKKIKRKSSLAAIAIFVLTTIVVLATIRLNLRIPINQIVIALILGLVCIGCISASVLVSAKKEFVRQDLIAFILQATSCFVSVFVLAISMFPTLVNAKTGLSVTILSSCVSDLSLTCMTIITCIFLPLVLFYHFIIYRTFAGRLSLDELEG